MAGVYLIAVFVLNELRRVGCFVVFLGVFFFSFQRQSVTKLKGRGSKAQTLSGNTAPLSNC